MDMSTSFVPLRRVWERVDIAGGESDATRFEELLLAAEFLLKMTVCGLVAALDEDVERNKYRIEHQLVRASGVGDWAEAANVVLTGPPAQHLSAHARLEARQLTERMGPGTWQYEVTRTVNDALRSVFPRADTIGTRAPCRQWMNDFATLRNKTRGHGALLPDTKARLAEALESALRLFTQEYSLFSRPWAYLHRNKSGKYRVTEFGTRPLGIHKKLTSESSFTFADGVYVEFDCIRRVSLAYSDADLSDFYVCNGSFNGKHFEMLSYETGSTRWASAAAYLEPATQLPSSHTQGVGALDMLDGGCAFTNLPPRTDRYVHRAVLEKALRDSLAMPATSVVSLFGRGGIGKTSLALEVLGQLAANGPFELILWFSARDIDLMADGPRSVQPRVLDQADIARDITALLQPTASSDKEFDPIGFLAESLSTGGLGAPTLFVFDNFETVNDPPGLLRWLFTYLRPPNKVLVTTRHRDFAGDYPIEVAGMTFEESQQLIRASARELGGEGFVGQSEVERVYKEADGHPYVMKILLGELISQGHGATVNRVFAARDDILSALFERTYASLSPVARRAFLTLSHWRSPVPEVALTAVLLRAAVDWVDVQAGVEELRRMSFVEATVSDADGTVFLTIPKVARLFGEKKLRITDSKADIERDRQLLLWFGAVQTSAIKQGFQPRIEHFLHHVANEVEHGRGTLRDFEDIFGFLGMKYPETWLRVAELYAEAATAEAYCDAIAYVERYLQETHEAGDLIDGWFRLADLAKLAEARSKEFHALAELAEVDGARYPLVAQAAHRCNTLRPKELNERQAATRVAMVMTGRIEEASADDCSKLAWLWVHLGEQAQAHEALDRGLSIDPGNYYCGKLEARLRAS